MRAHPTLALPLTLACVLALGGCNLFQPRTPEPPSRAGLRIDYSDPDSTLETLARAIEAKAPGTSLSAYMGGLGDSITAGDAENFIAYFDDRALAVWHGVTGKDPPAEWGPALERQFFGDLPNLSGNRYNFTWLRDVEHPYDEDPALNVKILHRQYLLIAIPAGGGTVEKLAIGYADLTFIKSNASNRWVIARWQDRVDPTVGPNPSGGQQSFTALRLKRIP